MAMRPATPGAPRCRCWRDPPSWRDASDASDASDAGAAQVGMGSRAAGPGGELRPRVLRVVMTN